MELHKRYFAVVALILTTFATMALADDFADARTKIDQAKPNIHYNTFCAEMNFGEDKIALVSKMYRLLVFWCARSLIWEKKIAAQLSTKRSPI